MTHTYQISGMTCSSCKRKVEELLYQITGVKKVGINLSNGEATIEMAHHISTRSLQDALHAYPKYQLSEKAVAMPVAFEELADKQKPWVETYKPILLIFFYITAVSFIAAASGHNFSMKYFMRIFMAGFFIVFSFFKLLNLDGFVDNYAMYDIVAKKFRQWGYIYAITELVLGLGYAANFQPVIINYITLPVMAISIIGVLQSVLNKRKIKCACLGAVFNLPMSTVTIIEDALMIAMSIAMIFLMK
jgi:cation transport ATPase